MNEEIKKWLESQHEWIQEAAYRWLTNGSISESDVLDFIGLIKTPTKTNIKPKQFPAIGNSPGQSIVRLISLGPVEGIDALKPKKPLEFGSKNLVVIYGENGSGKSGYVRILKNICGKPHSTALKPDVYKKYPDKQKCTIRYSFNGEEKTIQWLANSSPINDLSAVDIFDTANGIVYLEKETEVSYLPPELILFTELVDVCGKVEKALKSEQEKLVSKLPTIPTKYQFTNCANRYTHLKL